MTYFFGGRPILMSLIRSAASRGYRTFLVMGFIPALSSRFSAVFSDMPSFWAISIIVNPFILLLYYIIFGNKRHFPNKC